MTSSQVVRKLPSIPLTYHDLGGESIEAGIAGKNWGTFSESQDYRLGNSCLPMTGGTNRQVDAQRTHLHGIDEHPSQAERDALREFSSIHSYLETIPKVDMEDLPSRR